MRLRARVTAVVISATTIGTLLFGTAVVNWVQRSSLNDIDRALLKAVSQVETETKQGEDPLASALLANDGASVPMSIAFYNGAGDPVWLRTEATGLNPPDLFPVLDQSSGGVLDLQQFRVATLRVGDGESIIFAAWAQPVRDSYRGSMKAVIAFWLPFNLLTALLISLLVGRTTRRLEILASGATAAAHGAQLPVIRPGPAREEQELATAFEAVLETMRKALHGEQQAHRNLQRFIGDASHELRTPLTVLIGYLELLRNPASSLTNTERRWVERMSVESKRMEELVADLLLLAEIGSAETAPERRTIDLVTLLSEKLEDLSALQPDRPVTFEAPSTVTVHACPERIRRAVDNVLSNITRHTPPTAPVRVVLYADLDGDVVLTVEDAGPGLTEQQLAEGIAAFRRFDPSRSRHTGGSGLGMSILHSVVADLDGTVRLSRSDLGGLGVTITIPTTRTKG